MSWSAHEELRMLRLMTKLNPLDIEANGGPCPRVQNRILRENPRYVVKDETALNSILLAQGVLPWDKCWQYPFARLRELQGRGDLPGMEREFGALYEMAKAQIKAGPGSVTPSVYLGAVLFAGNYRLAFTRSKFNPYAQQTAVAAEDACRYFKLVVGLLERDETPVAELIKAKAVANMVVARWNACPRADRNSAEMQSFVTELGYMAWVDRQIVLFPLLDTAAFNALAIASRFRWQERYPALQEALEAAGSDFTNYSEFRDDDFDDYRVWRAEQRAALSPLPSPKDPTMKTALKKVVAAAAGASLMLAALLGFPGLVVPSKASPSNQQIEISYLDLRPHVFGKVEAS